MDNDKTLEANTQDTPKQDKNQAIILLNLEELIISHFESIEKNGIEIKNNKETLDSIFLNDPTYKNHLEAAKAANKIKNATRAEIIKRPDVLPVFDKIKNLGKEIKDLKQELSEYLREYQRMSGSNQIEDKKGEIREIVLTAKAVPVRA